MRVYGNTAVAVGDARFPYEYRRNAERENHLNVLHVLVKGAQGSGTWWRGKR